MPTYNGKPYSSAKNVNLKNGLLRFGRTYTSNPLPSDVYGLYVNSSNQLVFSRLGVDITLVTYSPSASQSPSSSASASKSPSASMSPSASRSPSSSASSSNSPSPLP